jgi:PKHD-type hydroxylase
VIVPIANVLDAETLAQVRELLAQGTYVDGKHSAGWHARLVKNNSQLKGGEASQRAGTIIRDALLRSEVFRAAVRPHHVRPMMFSRYSDGQNYGAHVDDAIMGRGDDVTRSDVSLTVFLSDAEDYEGGELVIEGTGGEQTFKLDAGSVITYPSNTLHYVAPVTRGTREVAVSWAQSLVRDPQHREMLFDLDTARRSLFQREGKSREFDLISKTHANLLRLWAET